jgi:hypothetical protein
VPASPVREVGEDALAGPDSVQPGSPVGAEARKAAADKLVVDGVPGLGLHARVDDRYDTDAELPDQAGKVGEGLRVDGEDAVAVHVVEPATTSSASSALA